VLGFEPMTYGSESVCATHNTTAPHGRTQLQQSGKRHVEKVKTLKSERDFLFPAQVRLLRFGHIEMFEIIYPRTGLNCRTTDVVVLHV